MVRRSFDAARRHIRHAGGLTLRRLGLLVDGQPNGLGHDRALLGGSLRGSVLVHFANPPRALYQLRQWYRPLEELHRAHGVTVVTRDSRAAAAIRAESSLPVITIAYHSTLDDLLSRSHVQLVLYVNFFSENFEMLRFSSMQHAALWHGDSDKSVSVSNQVKAFDVNLVPGQAAIDRLAAHLPGFDAESRCVIVGRPQVVGALAHARAPGDRIRVLYAPTWEGGHPSADYGSLESHGAGIVSSLLTSPRIALTYRPHPFSGLRRASFGTADADLRALVKAAASRDRTAGHRVSLGGSLGDDFASADLLITDISSVATDWLATGRPLLVTTPSSPSTVVASTRLLETVPRLPVSALVGLCELVIREVEEDPSAAARASLAEYYLHSTDPAESMARFLAECSRLIALNTHLHPTSKKAHDGGH
ncbi:MAG: CDP-glycerol glycerophosphotransferase family protein [Micrococcales bacterium]|nr:CDP-glycerol glycerophosphotransferase family protein [Micrococcales bacterium]